MTQEDKELLLKDLCARLPYGVIANVFSYWNEQWMDKKILGIDLDGDEVLVAVPGGRCEINLGETSFVKPYLRPMSSMTKEETESYISYFYDGNSFTDYYQLVDWFNEHHFDYRGLIEKGLALEAPENIY